MPLKDKKKSAGAQCGACCGATTNVLMCGVPQRIKRNNNGDLFKFNCHNSRSNELMAFQLIIVRPLAEML